MENMSLYKLDETIKAILENGLTFDYETGEVLFTSDDLDELKTSIEEKINNIVGYIKNLDLEAKMYSEVKKDYDAREKKAKKTAERLKKYLDSYLTSNNIEKKEVLNGTVSYRKSVSVEIDDEILRQYLEKHEDKKDIYTNTKVEWSKKGIGDDLKKGIEIDGAQLVENKNLQVK